MSESMCPVAVREGPLIGQTDWYRPRQENGLRIWFEKFPPTRCPWTLDRRLLRSRLLVQALNSRISAVHWLWSVGSVQLTGSPWVGGTRAGSSEPNLGFTKRNNCSRVSARSVCPMSKLSRVWSSGPNFGTGPAFVRRPDVRELLPYVLSQIEVPFRSYFLTTVLIILVPYSTVPF